MDNIEIYSIIEDIFEFTNCKSIKIPFSGSGDSGELESFYLEGRKANHESLTKDYRYSTWHDKLSDFGYIVLEKYAGAYDWYNNEGGQGTITLTIDKDKKSIHVDIDIGINYTQTETHNEQGEIQCTHITTLDQA